MDPAHRPSCRAPGSRESAALPVVQADGGVAKGRHADRGKNRGSSRLGSGGVGGRDRVGCARRDPAGCRAASVAPRLLHRWVPERQLRRDLGRTVRLPRHRLVRQRRSGWCGGGPGHRDDRHPTGCAGSALPRWYGGSRSARGRLCAVVPGLPATRRRVRFLVDVRPDRPEPRSRSWQWPGGTSSCRSPCSPAG